MLSLRIKVLWLGHSFYQLRFWYSPDRLKHIVRSIDHVFDLTDRKSHLLKQSDLFDSHLLLFIIKQMTSFVLSRISNQSCFFIALNGTSGYSKSIMYFSQRHIHNFPSLLFSLKLHVTCSQHIFCTIQKTHPPNWDMFFTRIS